MLPGIAMPFPESQNQAQGNKRTPWISKSANRAVVYRAHQVSRRRRISRSAAKCISLSVSQDSHISRSYISPTTGRFISRSIFRVSLSRASLFRPRRISRSEAECISHSESQDSHISGSYISPTTGRCISLRRRRSLFRAAVSRHSPISRSIISPTAGRYISHSISL